MKLKVGIVIGLVASVLTLNIQHAIAATLEEPKFFNVVLYKDSFGKLRPMELSTPMIARTQNIVGGWQKIVQIQGGYSPIKLAAGSHHEFAVKLPTGVDPSKFLLFKLTTKGNIRELVAERSNAMGYTGLMGTVRFDIVPMGASYKFVTPASLEQGEYCFGANDSADGYCFQVR